MSRRPPEGKRSRRSGRCPRSESPGRPTRESGSSGGAPPPVARDRNDLGDRPGGGEDERDREKRGGRPVRDDREDERDHGQDPRAALPAQVEVLERAIAQG